MEDEYWSEEIIEQVKKMIQSEFRGVDNFSKLPPISFDSEIGQFMLKNVKEDIKNKFKSIESWEFELKDNRK
jgi:hypothetical protein